MLKQMTYHTTADTELVLCDASQGSQEFVLVSILISGGDNGGNITLKIDDFDALFTVGANDTISVSWPIVVPAGSKLIAIATGDGMKVSVSAYYRAATEPLDLYPDEDEVETV